MSHMSHYQILLYAGITLPTVLYIALISQVFYSLHRQQQAHQPADLIWARNIDVERRKEIIATRSGPLLAYKYLILSNDDVTL